MILSRITPFLLLIAVVAGCSTLLVQTAPETGDLRAKTFAPIPGHAVVYVVRDSSLFGADYTSDFIVNGKLVATGARSRYNVVVLPPGDYKLGVTSSYQAGQYFAFPLRVDAGAIYYLQVDWETPIGFVLKRMPPENARAEITKGKLISWREF
jgi:hypothetical protein